MKKQYKEVHVKITGEPGERDWLYNVYEITEKGFTEIFLKDFKSRAAASRAANKIARKVTHWYPI
jgi:hypothetical protein